MTKELLNRLIIAAQSHCHTHFAEPLSGNHPTDDELLALTTEQKLELVVDYLEGTV